MSSAPFQMNPLSSPLFMKDRIKAGDEKIVINISGQRFETWRNTLEFYPDTLLGSNERELFYDEVNREYFFDRDAEIFRHILNFYRTGRLHYPRHECSASYDEELTFFGLLPDVIGNCCYDDYLARKTENVEWLASVNAVENPQTSPKTMRERLWRGFEDPHTSTIGLVFNWVSIISSAVIVLTIMLETLPEYLNRASFNAFHSYVQLTCVLIFTAEYLMRLYAAPSRCSFIRSPMAIVDIVTVVPFFVSLLIYFNNASFALASLRVFRIIRIYKFSRGWRIFGHTLKASASELGFLVFLLAMAVVIFATSLFYIEQYTEEYTGFTSIPAATWFAVVTMTTVGYGDKVPQTNAGKLVGSVCALTGVLFLAFFAAVVMSNYNRTYQLSQRKAELKARMDRIRISKNSAGDTVVNDLNGHPNGS